MRKNRPLWLAGLLLAGVMLVLAACGNAGNGERNGETPTNEAIGQGTTEAATGGEEADFPRTITDAEGEVVIEAQPERVAVVHWGYIDPSLIFDMPQTAFALPFTERQSALQGEEYQPYVEGREVTYVGENQQVNMEALLAFDPDLIIGGSSVNAEIAAELRKIATTVIIDEAQTDVWTDWPALVTVFGELLGQEEAASAYIADFDSRVEAAREALAGVEGTVAFTQVREDTVWLQGIQYTGLYYDRLGLTPPDDAVMAEGGQLSLEGLSTLGPDHLFLGYFNKLDTSLAAFTDTWTGTEVWKSLPAVQDGHVYDIDGSLALGYGPIGQSYGIRTVVEALRR
ncbi:ABC transporter substrate-binding protein [Paenibacillus sp. IB182496]|uniref:ABC transporter substrate-binding protein n=1 Tax=Paenibacillus sabuli TaxID=2772509 RepID=A0A927BXA1_9BACL|nr:ABC transporter substrate-binding protein [Paenibacillus sabuli]MBD2848578.1 ABC transporter substrate-binding protein [Paenibacillus sabuli]